MSTFVAALPLSAAATAATTLASSTVSVALPVSKWRRAGRTGAAAGAAGAGATAAAGAAGALTAGGGTLAAALGASLPPMSGTMSSATMLMILISGFTAGPAVSLYGSPTVSPVTAALCASDPFPPWLPSSMYFLALSHAPPPVVIEIATK